MVVVGSTKNDVFLIINTSNNTLTPPTKQTETHNCHRQFLLLFEIAIEQFICSSLCRRYVAVCRRCRRSVVRIPPGFVMTKLGTTAFHPLLSYYLFATILSSYHGGESRICHHDDNTTVTVQVRRKSWNLSGGVKMQQKNRNKCAPTNASRMICSFQTRIKGNN